MGSGAAVKAASVKAPAAFFLLQDLSAEFFVCAATLSQYDIVRRSL
jgi:hypothetical protein